MVDKSRGATKKNYKNTMPKKKIRKTPVMRESTRNETRQSKILLGNLTRKD